VVKNAESTVVSIMVMSVTNGRLILLVRPEPVTLLPELSVKE
jgi:hypothetical protein